MFQRTKLLMVTVIILVLLAACSQERQPIVVRESAPVSEADQEAIVRAAIATIAAEEGMQQPVIEPVSIEAGEAVTIPVTPEAIVLEPDADVIENNPSAAIGFALQDALITLYDQVNPSVVFIVVEGQLGLGSGSGFVFDNDGHIVTNNHVIENALNVDVVFFNGQRVGAEIVGRDVDSDLAVIRVDELPAEAPPLPLGDFNTVDVGQFVVAIGNPFGQQGSMSLGIVSGLGRSLESQRELDTTGGRYSLPSVIQTDAPINPGNSGGPLINLNGEVIGVNSAINTTTGFNSGVGFSIPVAAVRLVIPELISNGDYVYPYMGIQFSNLSVDNAERLGLPQTEGAYVLQVLPGTPAAVAGLNGQTGTIGQIGDLITAIDGNQIADFNDLNSYLVFNTKPGQTLDLTVIRDGNEISVPLTLGERP